MSLVSFEGVAVDLPTTLDGIKFAFTNGALTIQCHNFTGNIVMTKQQESLVLQSLVEAVESDVDMTQTSKKRSLQGTTENSPSSSADSATKRVRRPNFLKDVEQTMLLAQFEASQQSKESQVESTTASAMETELEPEAEAATESMEDDEQTQPLSLTQASPEQTTPAKATPVKSKKGTQSTLLKTSFFSPDPKERASKKKKETKNGSQPDIRQLMAPPPVEKTPIAKAPTAQWSSVSPHGPIPTERWGHSFTPISDNRVVVYGGADDEEGTLGDLHVLDLKTHTWSRPLNCESIPRTWHDAVYLATKQLVLVFGGERNVADDQTDVLSDIMVLDTDCFLWYPPAVSGTPPTARSGHTCAVLGNDVVVFGGSRGRSRQSAVHVLDSDTFNWKHIKIEGKPPSARTYHSAVTVGDQMIVYFGGNDAKKSFSSVHVLKKTISASGDEVTWSWFHPCVVGAAPRPRTGHSATLMDDSNILVFGGWDPQVSTTTTVFDDAFLLDTQTWEWKAVVIEPTNEPIGCVGHRAVRGENGTVFLFGGQNANEERMNAIHSLVLS